ncbi:hypothetical protein V0R52_23770 [Pseudomonas asiatica]|uniref:hypothetical protein n=1 Tax=Pseudomonas asiatica TaxID=2219225 RepID=UPI002E7B541E|nr:hypothetical protein [Pseudomonas asiatica]MEE1919416.1 hypothetical protein [Pseudomonas asiatica]
MYGHQTTPTKAARTCQALAAAARKAELQHDWEVAAEFYEAAATFITKPGELAHRDSAGLLRKAAACWEAGDRGQAAGPGHR